MNEILIWKKGCVNVAGNDPVAIINLNTADAVVDHWINCLYDNPNKFEIEIKSCFTFTEMAASCLHNCIGSVLLTYEKIKGSFSEEHVIMALYSTLQSFSFSEDRLERIREQELEKDNFDDQFLKDYGE